MRKLTLARITKHMRKVSSHLTYKQKRIVEDQLACLLKPLNDDRTLWEYIEEFSDQNALNLLKGVIPQITINHIRSVRAECFGPIKAIHNNILKQDLIEIHKRLGSLEHRFNTLLEKLGERA